MMIPSGNSWVTSLRSAPTIASLGTSVSTQDHGLNNKESTHRLARHDEESCCRNRQQWTLQRRTQGTATAATAGYEGRRNVWRDPGDRGRRNVVRKEYPGDWTCVLVQDLPTRTPSTWHHDVLNLSAGLAAMVGGGRTRTRPPVLSPRRTGDRQPSDPSRRFQPLDPPTHGF